MNVNLLDSFRVFMDTGGGVLWMILLLTLVLWTLIVERFLFLNFGYSNCKEQWMLDWKSRGDKQSWYAHRIREGIISQAKIKLGKTVRLINTLIALSPLLGLLGTVSGMIDVFDVMAFIGTGNARAMATGVSEATITTMAGMVVAISGLYFSKRIEDRVEDETRQLADLLTYQ